MKISVDGGGLGSKKGERFGNYIFSQNLIKALLKYDKKNQYFIYTFSKLKPRFAWSKIRLSVEEFRKKKDTFLALNQARPLYVSGKVISFCHGLSYYFFPKYYSLKDNLRLRRQLDEMILKSNIIVVSSIKVKKELESITVKYSKKTKIIIILFGIPFDMNRFTLHVTRYTPKKYFLYVGMDHPIKNISFIKERFSEFKKFSEFKNFKLKIITKNCSRKDLKKLYQNAAALLTASYYESFNLPVLEALSQGCPVIGLESAVIPELHQYVNLAKNEKEFLELMKTIPKKPDTQLIKQLNKEFNWKNYVEKLVKLYL
jgi:glycosyltransferase involved in cell wall biosynthesis